MNNRGTYKCFTKIDLSMMFYCFELDQSRKSMCIITTLFGNFAYTRLPMGVKISPDVAQAYMVEMLQGIPSECYMDDVDMCTNGSFKEHMAIINQILQISQQNEMKCNPLKCSWEVQETYFLGYWMTPTAKKPWEKITEAILLLQEPKNNYFTM